MIRRMDILAWMNSKGASDERRSWPPDVPKCPHTSTMWWYPDTCSQLEFQRGKCSENLQNSHAMLWHFQLSWWGDERDPIGLKLGTSLSYGNIYSRLQVQLTSINLHRERKMIANFTFVHDSTGMDKSKCFSTLSISSMRSRRDWPTTVPCFYHALNPSSAAPDRICSLLISTKWEQNHWLVFVHFMVTFSLESRMLWSLRDSMQRFEPAQRFHV